VARRKAVDIEVDKLDEVPKVGDRGYSIRRVDDKIAKYEYQLITAITGKAIKIADAGEEHGTLWSHHTIKGRQYLLVWADRDISYSDPDHEELTIKLPKATYEKYVKLSKEQGYADPAERAALDLTSLAKAWGPEKPKASH
jgi:hypothetical protein